MMKMKSKLFGALLAMAAMHGVAHAAVSCEDSAALIGNAGYVACQGSFIGNIAPGQTNLVSFEGYGEFALQGTSDGPGAGPFSDSATQVPWELSFDDTLYGRFVVGIKGGPSYSLYLFDAGTEGIFSLNFDTLGVAKGNGRPGPDLSHAALFLPTGQPVSAVPEAPAWATMLGGIGLLALIVRRRR